MVVDQMTWKLKDFIPNPEEPFLLYNRSILYVNL